MRAAVVADVQESRLAGDPVLHGIAVAHDERYVADALGETRVRLPGPEPPLVHEPPARHDVRLVPEPILCALGEIFRRVHVAIDDAPLAAERESQRGKER